MSHPLRIAVLGCGTIVKSQHLPAILAHPDARLVSLVDVDVNRAAALARNSGITCQCSSDYREVFSEADAVLNALPNHLHAPVTLEALAKGLPVLCEKPLAIRAADARNCAVAAADRGLVLAVGMNRRFQPNHSLLKAILTDRLLGELKSYDWQVGGPYDWSAASGFYFSKEQAGGGAFLDYGVHLLDSLMDWFGPVTDFQYEDDDWGGGIEANVRLTATHEGPFGRISGLLRISRTYPLSNSLFVHGSLAVAELPLSTPDAALVHRQLNGQAVTETIAFAGSKPRHSSFYLQLDNFVRSVRGEEKPAVDGFQAATELELIERCYAKRTRLPEPWSEIDEYAGVPA
jgi:predicted dehydrogenase